MLDHYVYFVGPDLKYKESVIKNDKYYSPIKVGVTKNIDQRLKNIQTSCFFHLDLILKLGPYSKEDAYKLEAELHRFFSNFNSSGEWFLLNFERLKGLETNLSLIIGKNEVNRLTLFMPIYDRNKLNQRKDRRLHWEISRFREVCLKINKDFKSISSEIFWQLIDANSRCIAGHQLPEFKFLKMEDRISLAAAIFGTAIPK